MEGEIEKKQETFILIIVFRVVCHLLCGFLDRGVLGALTLSALDLAWLQGVDKVKLGGVLGGDELNKVAREAAEEGVAPTCSVKIVSEFWRWLQNGRSSSLEVNPKEIQLRITHLPDAGHLVHQRIDKVLP